MSDWGEIAKELTKLATRPRYSFALWVSAFLLLAVPLPDFLKLNQLSRDYGQYIGLVTVLFVVVWIVEVSLIMKDAFIDRASLHRHRHETLKQLDSLNSQEAHLLSIAVENKTQTVVWREDYDEVNSLVAKGLLDAVSGKSMTGSRPFTLPRFVWDHLNKKGIYDEIRAKDKERKH
jgi:hypothetical protein